MLTSTKITGPTEIAPGLVLVPTGGLVGYVHASGAAALDQLPPGMPAADLGFHTSVNAALNAARSGRGDRIVCLPGHTENIAAADAWSNLGTKTDVGVIGMGHGVGRPTFTWTAATSTLLMDAASFHIDNCRMFWAGADAAGSALTVAAPITVSAAGCSLTRCDVRAGFDADQIVTIGLTTTAAADDLTLQDVKIVWATAAECTTMIQAVGADRLTMRRCYVRGATSSTTVGVLRFLTTLSANIDFEDCAFVNTKAASVNAVTGMTGVSGVCRRVFQGILDNATLAGWSDPESVQFDNLCSVANLAGETGAVKTTIST